MISLLFDGDAPDRFFAVVVAVQRLERVGLFVIFGECFDDSSSSSCSCISFVHSRPRCFSHHSKYASTAAETEEEFERRKC